MDSAFKADRAPRPSDVDPKCFDRRQIMGRFGRYAAVTAPAMMVLLPGRAANAQNGPGNGDNPGTDPGGPPGGGFSP